MTLRPAAPRALLLALSLLTVTVGGAALAWACTPHGNVAISSPAGSGFAHPGGQASVGVTGYAAGAQVALHWNGESGPVIGTGTGPEFTTSVTIPVVEDGVYVVIARGLNADGSERYGRAPVAVAAPRPATPAVEAESQAGAGASAPAAASDSGRAPAPAVTTTGSSAREVAARRANGAGLAAADRGQKTAGQRGASKIRSGAGAERSGTAGDSTSAVATAPSGQAVFADSVEPEARRVATRRGSSARSGSAPSERSAEGDLWGGFSGDGPARAGLDSVAGPAEGPGSALTLAFVLGGMGIMALAGGVGAAEVRRRRKVARASVGSRE